MIFVLNPWSMQLFVQTIVSTLLAGAMRSEGKKIHSFKQSCENLNTLEKKLASSVDAIAESKGRPKKCHIRHWAQICSRSSISLFHMCIAIRILSPFHLETWIIPIQHLNRLKNAKNNKQCADAHFSHLIVCCDQRSINTKRTTHCFMRFWMAIIKVSRWNERKILIPNHTWKRKSDN